MKTWGVVCALLSGAIFAAMLASMHSCSESYEIDAKGQLCKVEAAPSSGSPGTLRLVPVPWTVKPQIQSLERWVRPGDKVVSTETDGGLWLELKMTKVEVFRNDEAVMLVRGGHILFWSITLGLSLFPMIAWGIGALWIANLSPQRHRGRGDSS